MERYRNNIQDQFGNAISGVTVTVRLESSGALATIFSDNSLTAKSNPFDNDPDGEFFFYAADERYDIFFSGPITDQIDDVLLQDTGALGPTLRILADINTATPPTTEGVTALLRYSDLDNTDDLALVGFDNSVAAEFRISNLMRGGAVRITGINVGGTIKSILVGDPDGSTTLYYAGVQRLIAAANGTVVLRSEGSTDSESRVLVFQQQNALQRGLVGHDGGATCKRNAV